MALLRGGDRRTGRWTEEEDVQLRQLVAEYDGRSWAFISQYIPGRDGKSCRLRWTNQISPEIVHAPFTSDEDAKIVEEIEKCGNQWAAIARLLPGRTENSVKNRWYSCLKHRGGCISRRSSTVVSSTGRQSSSVVLSPSETSTERASVSGTGSSNFDDGTDDPLTTLSLWLPYGGTSKNTRVLQN